MRKKNLEEAKAEENQIKKADDTNPDINSDSARRKRKRSSRW